jgi:hypothetical protein
MNLNLKKLQEKMPKLHLHLKVEKDGEVISDSYQIGHSWTRNAYNFYILNMIDGTSIPPLHVKTADGIYYGSTYMTRYNAYAGSVNNISYGIQVGSDDTAFNIEDYKLYGLIPTGNTSGTLYAQAQVSPVQSFSGAPDNSVNMLYSRVFNNNSGGTIIVKEVGFVYSTGENSGSSKYLFSRDVLESAVNVLDGAQLTVTVSITTQDLTDLYYIPPEPWTAGMGGYYLGQITRADDSTGGFSFKYAVIVAPKTGGELSAAALSTSQDVSSLASIANSFYGGDQTTALIALGADSPQGIACAAQNTAVLGGYSDWYIPSYYELELFYTNRAYIPSGQEFSNEQYWTSTYSGWEAPKSMDAGNPTTGVLTPYEYANSTYKTRLVRRILLANWLAD